MIIFLQDPAILQFLLSNLIKVNGKFQWRVNLPSIRDHIIEIGNFPFCVPGDILILIFFPFGEGTSILPPLVAV